jgi:hypothetical protein
MSQKGLHATCILCHSRWQLTDVRREICRNLLGRAFPRDEYCPSAALRMMGADMPLSRAGIDRESMVLIPSAFHGRGKYRAAMRLAGDGDYQPTQQFATIWQLREIEQGMSADGVTRSQALVLTGLIRMVFRFPIQDW